MKGKKVDKTDAVKRGKPKFIISGNSGVGKTTFMLQFPRPFIIDCEGGAVEPQYVEAMKKVGAWYMGKDDGSQDFKTVIDTLKELATTKHDYQTLVIDSFSKLYNLTAAIAEEKVGNVYAADKKEAQKPTRQLQIWMDKLDMTIALVCHSKAQWKNAQPTGATTYDGWDKLEYDLNLWLELVLTGRKRDLIVRKSRIEGFILGNSYPADYDTFAKLYGAETLAEPVQKLVLATQDQILEANGLIAAFNITEDEKRAKLKKYDVDELADLTSDQIGLIIASLKSKLPKGAVNV